MSASRALPEGFDANDMWALAAPVESRMPRAQIGVARRALATDDAGGYRVACRALVEHESPVLAQSGLEEPRNRKPAGSRVAASLALLVAVSSLSGAAIAGSAALPITPTATASTPAVAREVSVSRDASRTLMPSTPAASLPSVIDVPADVVLVESPAQDESQPPAEAAPATTAAVETPAAPALTVATNIAPSQLPAASVEEAIARAGSMTGNWGYQNMCLSLVATFYGYTSAGEVGAQQAAATITAAGQMNTDLTDIPVGALIWYDGTPIGNPYGHVALYAGNGMVYSNGAPTGVGLIPLTEPADGWGEPIIGWSSVWLPTATR